MGTGRVHQGHARRVEAVTLTPLRFFAPLLAGVVTTASQIAVRRWFDADPPVELRPLVREALGELTSAFADATRRIQPG